MITLLKHIHMVNLVIVAPHQLDRWQKAQKGIVQPPIHMTACLPVVIPGRYCADPPLHGSFAVAGETIEAGDSIRNIFMQAVYEQMSENLQSGGVAQGSNFWNLYSVGVGSDDPYQITLADTSTMAIIGAAVRHPQHLSRLSDSASLASPPCCMQGWQTLVLH